MTQTRNIAKTMFVILALVFAATATAKAEGRVNFSFSINVNGQQAHGNNFNQFFNHVNKNGGQRRNYGHYHIGANGMQYWVEGNHNQHKKTYKQKKKIKRFAQLTSKKRLVRHLRKLGYRHVRRIHKNGRYYTARAISPKGNVVWLKVDRRNGRIKGRRVLAWNHRG